MIKILNTDKKLNNGLNKVSNNELVEVAFLVSGDRLYEFINPFTLVIFTSLFYFDLNNAQIFNIIP